MESNRPDPARPPADRMRSNPKRGAKLSIKFERVPYFGTPESPEPKCGINLSMKFERVLHFGTPEWPDLLGAVNLELDFEKSSTL